MNKAVEYIPKPTTAISVAWSPFTRKLAAVLAELREDQCLILSDKCSRKIVQFAIQGSFGVRAETLSNTYLPSEQQLNEEQTAALISAGWHPPTKGADSTPESDIDGSPNFFLEYPAPVNLETVAKLAVDTFTQILRVPHPVHLQYYSFDVSNGAEIQLPELGLKVADRTPQGVTADLLLDTLRKTTGLASLVYDADGDVGLRFGSAYLYIGLINDGQHVRLFSIILCDVRASHSMYVRLNYMNASDTLARFFYRDGTVVCSAEIRGTPFVAGDIDAAFWWFSNVADSMGRTLQNQFGGQVAFADDMQSSMKH